MYIKRKKNEKKENIHEEEKKCTKIKYKILFGIQDEPANENVGVGRRLSICK